MPVFLEPDQQFEVVLECDKDKPAENRPTFLARSQSMRGQRKVLQALDDAVDPKNQDLTVDQMFIITVDTLMSVLVGWRNMGSHAFSRESIEDVLSFNEARELLRKIAFNQTVQHEEKKS